MSTSASHDLTCRFVEILAYLDGELDSPSSELLEAHLAECVGCAAELKVQKRLLAELELALDDDAGVELPGDFARVVAARAQADLSGMRNSGERKRAIVLCSGLLILSVVLLGGDTASESVLGPMRLIWKSAAALFSFLGHALYDAGAGIAVISRGVGGHMLFGSRPIGLLIVLLFASALFMLRRLIVGYHRTRSSI